MYFLLFLVIIIVCYVKSFKENFTTEKIEKVTPVLFFTLLITVVLCILSSTM